MIEVRHLTRRFGTFTAVDDISFTVGRGEAFGFIGPNGAGKTTTIRILATLLQPDEGTALIGGYDISRDLAEVRARVGYMPDSFGLYDDMRVWEYLDFFAAAYKVPSYQRPRLIRDVLELVDLGLKREAYVQSLSRGMKQRLCLAKTLVHDPDVLLLDEPASGLDPRARIEMRELLQELCAMDKTILISSHILPELAELCTRIGIIEQGRIVTTDSVAGLTTACASGRRLHVKLALVTDAVLAYLRTQPGVRQVEAPVAGQVVTVDFTGDDEVQRQLLAGLITAGYPVLTFSEETIDLEGLYLKLTEGVVS